MIFVFPDILHTLLLSRQNQLRSKFAFRVMDVPFSENGFRKRLDLAVSRFLKSADKPHRFEISDPLDVIEPSLTVSNELLQSIEEAVDQGTTQIEPEFLAAFQGPQPTSSPARVEAQTPGVRTLDTRESTQGVTQIPQPKFDPQAPFVPVRNPEYRQDFERFVQHLQSLTEFNAADLWDVIRKAAEYSKADEVELAKELMKTLVSIAEPERGAGPTTRDVIDILFYMRSTQQRSDKWYEGVDFDALTATAFETMLDQGRFVTFFRDNLDSFTYFIEGFLKKAEQTDKFDGVLTRLGVTREFQLLRKYAQKFRRSSVGNELGPQEAALYHMIKGLTIQHALRKIELFYKDRGLYFDFFVYGRNTAAPVFGMRWTENPIIFNDVSTFVGALQKYYSNTYLTETEKQESIQQDALTFSYLFMLNLPRFLDLRTLPRKEHYDIVTKFLTAPTPENWFAVVDNLLRGQIHHDLYMEMRNAGIKVLPDEPFRPADSALLRVYYDPATVVQYDLVKFIKELTHEGYIQVPKPVLDRLERWYEEQETLVQSNDPSFNQAAVLYVLAQLHRCGVLTDYFGRHDGLGKDVRQSQLFSHFLGNILDQSNVFLKNDQLWRLLRAEMLPRPFTIFRPAPETSGLLDALSFVTNQQEFYYNLNEDLHKLGYTLKRLDKTPDARISQIYEQMKMGIADAYGLGELAKVLLTVPMLSENWRALFTKTAQLSEVLSPVLVRYLHQHTLLSMISNAQHFLNQAGHVPGGEQLTLVGEELLELLKNTAIKEPENVYQLIRLLDGQAMASSDYVTGRWVISAVQKYHEKSDQLMQSAIRSPGVSISTPQMPMQQPMGMQSQSVQESRDIISWFNSLSPIGRLSLFLGIPLTAAGLVLSLFGKPSSFILLLLGLGTLGVGTYYEISRGQYAR